ncbi:MAG: hypothetical protein GW941_01125 [Candidatus Pacebacteria bacterium]|nr:hypothetical protein [Candidatus Paceibacterota bacterium]
MIECQQNKQPCPKATTDKLGHLYNQSLFFTNFDDTLSQIADYQISKKLPDTIILELENVQTNYYQLNDENIFKISQEEKLEKDLNSKINNLVSGLEQMEINYQNIRLENNIFIILLNNNYRALIDSTDLENGIYKLNQILNNIELKEIDNDIKEIDTRYKMPVLKTKETVI